MNFVKAIVKFIIGGLAGLLLWAFGFGCLMVCNSYQRVASDGTMYFVLVILILVCGGGYAAEDISEAKSDINLAVELKKRREEALEAERRRKEREEADRRESERLRLLIDQTRKKIHENQGYELNILPFLDYLSDTARTDVELVDLVRSNRDREARLKNLARELNQISTQYHLGDKLNVHVR